MNWPVGGFIPIIIYGGGITAEQEQNALLTEDNLDIFTESSNSILTE